MEKFEELLTELVNLLKKGSSDTVLTEEDLKEINVRASKSIEWMVNLYVERKGWSPELTTMVLAYGKNLNYYTAERNELRAHIESEGRKRLPKVLAEDVL